MNVVNLNVHAVPLAHRDGHRARIIVENEHLEVVIDCPHDNTPDAECRKDWDEDGNQIPGRLDYCNLRQWLDEVGVIESLDCPRTGASFPCDIEWWWDGDGYLWQPVNDGRRLRAVADWFRKHKEAGA